VTASLIVDGAEGISAANTSFPSERAQMRRAPKNGAFL
jgi:hypothetical protein